jgi:hypothetical protein
VFAQDDWRVRPNLTFSYGLRYEWQTNIADHGDFAPRLGFAWAPGKAKNGRQKTVVRGGFGMFYDRVAETLIERALLLNGTTSFPIPSPIPDTFPNAPPLASLTLRRTAFIASIPRLRSDYLMQSAIGVERQLPRNTTVAVTYTNTRALHTASDRAHQHAASRHLHSRPALAACAPTASPPAISSSTNPAAS